MRFGKLSLVVVLVGLCAASVPSQAQTSAFTLTSTDDYRNNSWAFGELFTIGSQNLTISGLGAYDAGGNGFVTAGGIPVGLYRVSDGVLLASTNVTSADPLTNRFRYSSVAPLTLTSGVQYEIVAVNESDLYNLTGATVNPLITDNGFNYGQSTTLQRLNTFTGNGMLWMANFQIAPAVAVPEPGSLALLVGIGMTSAGFLARRRKNARKAL